MYIDHYVILYNYNLLLKMSFTSYSFRSSGDVFEKDLIFTFFKQPKSLPTIYMLMLYFTVLTTVNNCNKYRTRNNKSCPQY